MGQEKVSKYKNLTVLKDFIPCKMFKDSAKFDGDFPISNMFIDILPAEVTPKS